MDMKKATQKSAKKVTQKATQKAAQKSLIERVQAYQAEVCRSAEDHSAIFFQNMMRCLKKKKLKPEDIERLHERLTYLGTISALYRLQLKTGSGEFRLQQIADEYYKNYDADQTSYTRIVERVQKALPYLLAKRHVFLSDRDTYILSYSRYDLGERYTEYSLKNLPIYGSEKELLQVLHQLWAFEI
jgi:hypothetical protein